MDSPIASVSRSQAKMFSPKMKSSNTTSSLPVPIIGNKGVSEIHIHNNNGNNSTSSLSSSSSSSSWTKALFSPVMKMFGTGGGETLSNNNPTTTLMNVNVILPSTSSSSAQDDSDSLLIERKLSSSSSQIRYQEYRRNRPRIHSTTSGKRSTTTERFDVSVVVDEYEDHFGMDEDDNAILAAEMKKHDGDYDGEEDQDEEGDDILEEEEDDDDDIDHNIEDDSSIDDEDFAIATSGIHGLRSRERVFVQVQQYQHHQDEEDDHEHQKRNDSSQHQREDEAEEEEEEEGGGGGGGEGQEVGNGDEQYVEFNPYLFMGLLPPYELVRDSRVGLHLPHRTPSTPKLSLVLDLDETLVHCSVDALESYDVTFAVDFNGNNCQVFVKKRPHLETFLERVSQIYEITVFTASQKVYAEKMLDILDPSGRWIKHRLYRESCLFVGGNYLKDLNVLGRDLSHTIIVDNSPHAFGYQIGNGIPITSWFDDANDTELLELICFLERLANHEDLDDVRPHLEERYGVPRLVQEALMSATENEILLHRPIIIRPE